MEQHIKIGKNGKIGFYCNYIMSVIGVLPRKVLANWLAIQNRGIANEPILAILAGYTPPYRGGSQIANGQYFGYSGFMCF